MKIFVADNQINYINFIRNASLTDNIEEADLVLFTGGEDVDPTLYEEENAYSYSNIVRDNLEITQYSKAMELDIPCLGICRGSQFLTVMNKGKLIQDVSSHAIAGTHLIKNFDKEYSRVILPITSTHHQMMYPFNLKSDEYKLLAISVPNKSKYYRTGFGSYNKKDVPFEPEIIFYPKSKSLAIQGHPEYMEKDSTAVDYCNWLINKYLL